MTATTAAIAVSTDAVHHDARHDMNAWRVGQVGESSPQQPKRSFPMLPPG